MTFLEEDWDGFEHKIVEQPTATAKINKEGKLEVAVKLKIKHWIGDETLAQPVTHAMGFIIPLEKLWTIAEDCETPYRHCNGRFPCGGPEQLLSDEVFKDYLSELEKLAGRKLETGADIREALRTYGFPGGKNEKD